MPSGAGPVDSLQNSVAQLDRTGKNHELDSLVERTLQIYPNDWRVLFQAARIYSEAERTGYQVDGKFRRGEAQAPPKGARKMYAHRRDMARALQLLHRAILASANEVNTKELADFYWEAGQILTGDKGYLGLYYLTNLNVLPSYDFREPQPATREPVPVDASGQPIFFVVPKSWETARNDGERLLWLLSRAQSLDPSYAAEAEFIRNKYLLRDYLGVESIAAANGFDPYNKVFRQNPRAQELLEDVHTLSDDETIARLITGVQRFKLPPEQNYLKRFQQMVFEPSFSSHAQEALEQLAEIHENRRQCQRAAKYWDDNMRRFPPNALDWEQQRQSQITGNWGKLEETQPFQAGDEIKLGFWFRNATKVDFTAHRIDVNLLLNDLLAYLRSDPFPLQIDRIQLSRLGNLLVHEANEEQPETPAALENAAKKNGKNKPPSTEPPPVEERPVYERDGTDYLLKKEKDPRWSMSLEPLKDHWDRRIEVPLPFNQPGAYLVEAKLDGGNTSTVIVWVNDMTIVRRRLEDGMFYYVADKRSGGPVAWAKFQFVGYRLEPISNDDEPDLDQHGAEVPEALRRQYHVHTKDVTKWADAKGQLVLKKEELPPEYQWFLLTTASPDKVALLGFSDLSASPGAEAMQVEAQQHFLIADRKAYLPGQEIQFKGWLRGQSPEEPNGLQIPVDAEVEVLLADTAGREWSRKVVRTGPRGGISGVLPAPTAEGSYTVTTKLGAAHGSVSFSVIAPREGSRSLRVEPPTSRVKRGQKIALAFRGFQSGGEAMSGGRIYYNVRRRPWTSYWRPSQSFDWLYGQGHAWTNVDSSWYPGWDRWGWPMPKTGQASPPSSLITEGYIDLSREGEAFLDLATVTQSDTPLPPAEEYLVSAKLVGDETVSITDERSFVVSDQAFKVYVQMDQSYYHVGDSARFEAWTKTFDGAPVQSSGQLVISELSFEASGSPREMPITRYSLSTDASGHVSLDLKATKTGQYRLAFEVSDAQGNKADGSTLRFVADDAYRGDHARFNFLELVTDRQRYKAGEHVRLRINTDQPGRNAAVFVRPKQGVYGQAEVVKLNHKSTAYDIDVRPDDVPSFFVEAILLHQGHFEVFTKEIIVEPVDPTARVTLSSDKEHYRPGDTAKFKVDLKMQDGKPMEGEALLVLHPAGASSSEQDIRAALWSKRQSYEPSIEFALKTTFEGYARPADQAMKPIGFFGPKRDIKANRSEDESGQENDPDQNSESDSKGQISPANLVSAWKDGIAIPANGLAEFDLPLPHEPGAWEARILAVGDNSRVSESKSTFVIEEDASLDLLEPPYLVSGDQTTLTAKVGNHSAKSSFVRLQLSATGALDLGAPEGLKKALRIAARGRETLDWPLVARETLEQGQSTVAVAAQGENQTALEARGSISVLSRTPRSLIWQGARFASGGALSLNSPVAGGILSVELANSLPAYLSSLAPPDLLSSSELAEPLALKLLMLAQLRKAALAQLGKDVGQSRDIPWYVAPEPFAGLLRDGLKKIGQSQQQDGGWSYGKAKDDPSDPLATAFIVHALYRLRELGAEFPAKWMDDARARLRAYAKAEAGKKGKISDTVDALVYWALSTSGSGDDPRDALVRDMGKLSLLGKVALGLGLHHRDEVETRDKLRFALGEKLIKDESTEQLSLKGDQPSQLSLADPDLLHALYLRFLVLSKGDSPVADNLASYVIAQRLGQEGWRSLRATALATDALLEYYVAKGSPVSQPPPVALSWPPEAKSSVPLTPPNAATPVRLAFDQSPLPAGTTSVACKAESGPIYFSAFVRAPTQAPAASGLALSRTYHRVTTKTNDSADTDPAPGPPISETMSQAASTRAPLESGAILSAGDTVEISLDVQAERECEQVRLIDHIPAGFAFQKSSLQDQDVPHTVREEKGFVEFYLARLSPGRFSISYQIRAVLPGGFQALPAEVAANYPPNVAARTKLMSMRVSKGVKG